MTVNATSGSSQTNQLIQSQTAVRPAQSQSSNQGSSLPQDTVTLSHAAQQGAGAQKSSGDVDHDGDSH